MRSRLPLSEQFVRTANPTGLGHAIQKHVAAIPAGELDELVIVPMPALERKPEPAADAGGSK